MKGTDCVPGRVRKQLLFLHSGKPKTYFSCQKPALFSSSKMLNVLCRS